MIRLKVSRKLLVAVCLAAVPATAFAQDVVHAVAGALTKIDKTAKTVTVKTVDGTEQVFKYSEHTAVRDTRGASHIAKMGAVETYFAGKEGTKVVVRYTVKGADNTAAVVDDFGKDALKAGKGTVTHVDRASHTVAIKMDDGAEATYKWGSDAVADTDHGVVKGSRYVAKEGDKVVVHYTQDAGGKLLQFFKKL